jgi:hypothetical protein
VGLVLALPVRPRWDGAIYARAAVELAEGRGYTWRVLREGAPPIPTAFYPVGFPAWLAGLRLAHVDALLAQAVLGALLVPIAWFLARRVGGARAGAIAAWLAALWPGGVLFSISWLAEPLFSVLAGAAVTTVLAARRRRSLAAWSLAGVVLGLAAWVRPTALPIAGLLGWVRGRTRGAVVMLAIALACLAPWIVRNQRALGATLSTNAGFNLLLGTMGRGAFGEVPPALDCDPALAEADKDRCRVGLAIARIEADPIAWLGRGALKLADTFGHESTPGFYLGDAALRGDPAMLRTIALVVSEPAWIAIAIAAAVGAWCTRRRRSTHALLAPIAALALLHFVFIGGDRYHADVAPMILALAGVGLARVRRTR